MFKALEPLLSQSTLIMTISQASHGQIQVTVTPKVKEGAHAALCTPLVLQGEAGELDVEFAALIASYSGSRRSLQEQLTAAEAVMKAAKDTASKDASKAVAKSHGEGRKSKGASEKPVLAEEGSDEDGSDGETSEEAIAATNSTGESGDKTQESLFG